MSLLQEIQKNGLADCQYNNLLNKYCIYQDQTLISAHDDMSAAVWALLKYQNTTGGHAKITKGPLSSVKI